MTSFVGSSVGFCGFGIISWEFLVFSKTSWEKLVFIKTGFGVSWVVGSVLESVGNIFESFGGLDSVDPFEWRFSGFGVISWWLLSISKTSWEILVFVSAGISFTSGVRDSFGIILLCELGTTDLGTGVVGRLGQIA